MNSNNGNNSMFFTYTFSSLPEEVKIVRRMSPPPLGVVCSPIKHHSLLSINGIHNFSIPDHTVLVIQARAQHIETQQESNENVFSCILNQLDPVHQRSAMRNWKSLSALLTAVPIQRDHFDLSATEFSDALCLRYMKPLVQLPLKCDG